MEADSRPRRLLAACVKAVSFFLHPVRGPLALVLGPVLVVVALESLPRIPESLRPYTQYKQRRADELVSNAIAARRSGDLRTARLALESALALAPQSRVARLALASVFADQRRFDEASAQAALVGMDGPSFVHDFLFHEARASELLEYCVQQVLRGDRRGAWLQSTLMTVRHASQESRTAISTRLLDDSRPAALMIRAIVMIDRPSELGAALDLRSAAGPLDPSEILVSIELLTHSGQTDAAWLWLERHRNLLGAFDQRCADYRLALAREPLLARTILESFPAFDEMSDARWMRLAGVVASGDALAADTFCRMLSEARPRPPAPLAVSAWSLLMLHRREATAANWEHVYRQAGGSALPILAARQLSDSDPVARARAVRLLAASTPLPREMIAALLMR